MSSHHGEVDGTASSSIPSEPVGHNSDSTNTLATDDTAVTDASVGSPSASGTEHDDAVEAADAVSATATEETSTEGTAAASPTRHASPAAPDTPVAPVAPAAPAEPAAPLPPAAPETAASTSEVSLPIRQPARPTYRPVSPPLPPIPTEWQNPSARPAHRELPPAPLPPYPAEWTAQSSARSGSNSNTSRTLPRRPSAANHARTQSSSNNTSGTVGVAAARRTSMAGGFASSNSEPPLPPAPPVGYESRPMPRPQQQLQQPQQPQQPQRPDFVVPRWQPDSEVTACPICHTVFRMLVRKHHCRKCGRVVCNSCSPHRITIPYQFIVQPPGSQPYQIQASGSHTGLAGDMNYLGGGERVRLCNPCVPDPNTAPPQTTSPSATDAASGSSSRYHSRSFSSVHGNSNTNANTNERYAAPSQYSYNIPGHGASTTVISAAASSSASTQNRNRHNRLSLPPMAASNVVSAAQETMQQYLQQGGYQQQSQQQQPQPQHSHNHRPRQPQPPPQPQIAEEDECPICRRELPQRSLPNFETLREAHITECLEEHSRYMGGSSSASNNVAGTNTAGMSTSLPSNVAEASSSTAPPAPPRMTGMFPYRATEKDCVNDAECTICLEEFEVGVRMARLECFCRFHEQCIRSWFKKHPGRCPVHQHDSFGY